MPEITLHVSHSIHARYTTATSTYERLAIGIGKPLTDKSIQKWQNKGYYGAKPKQRKRKRVTSATKRSLASLAKEYLGDV